MLMHLSSGRSEDPFIVWPAGPIAWSTLCLAVIPAISAMKWIGVAPLKTSFALLVTIIGIVSAIELRPQTFQVPQQGGQAFHSASLGQKVAGVAYVGPSRTVISTYYPDNPHGEFQRVRTSGRFDLRTLALLTEGDVSARKTTSREDQQRCRVELSRIDQTSPWRIRVYRLVPNLASREHWLLSFRMRAEAPRTIALTLREHEPPWNELLPSKEFEIGPDWKSFEIPCIIPRSVKAASIEFTIGNSNIPCEWDSVAWTCTQTDRRYPKSNFIVNHVLNNDGFRSGEHTVEKAPNLFRVAFLGDSYTYGQGVPEGREFARVVERNLRALAPTGQEIEVLNFGISGYDTEQERLSYEHWASKYQPDLVVLVMFENDIDPPATVAWTDGRSAEVDPSFDNRVTRSSVNEGFKRCARHLYHLKKRCDAGGAQLVVVVLNLFDSTRSRELVQILSEVESELHVPVLNTFPDFQKFGLSFDQIIVHPTDHHCNGRVHQIVGDMISRWLAKQHWIPQRGQ
jgi:hypothetical protein